MNRKLTQINTWLLCMVLFFLSCDDKMEDHYNTDNVKSSVWELLVEEGNYSTFLEAVELSGYRPYLEGKGITTVMAPDNQAFATYLSEHDYNSLADVPLAELKKLTGFHLLYYSLSKDMLLNYRPEGPDGDPTINAGMYYKFRTRSSSPLTYEYDALAGKERAVYHLERFVPVFSFNFFNTKGIEAKKNYEYFYPESTWTGSGGFNVSDASVTEYELIANNGYIYCVDRVMEPLETIYDEMKNNPDYSEFMKIYNSYSSYEYDAILSADYGTALGVDSLFLHKHLPPLPPIALEWPVSDYTSLAILASRSYSLFAPSNTALSNFYDSYWKDKGYESVSSIDPMIMQIFLYEFVYTGSAVFPDEIVSGKITNAMPGTTYNFDPYSLTSKKMCVNGSFYGLDEIEEPYLFSSVLGPALQSKENAAFLYMVNGSGLLSSFSATQHGYTLLMPTYSTLTGSGFQLTTYESGNVLEWPGDSGMEAVPSAVRAAIVNTHTLDRETTFDSDGTQVYPTRLPYSYWFIKDGRLTTSKAYLAMLNPDLIFVDPFVDLTEVKPEGADRWRNGRVFTYDAAEILTYEDPENTLQRTLAITNYQNDYYFYFATLLKAAGMILGDNITILEGGRYITFIPTNEALEQALYNNEIPGLMNAYIDTNDGTLIYDEIDVEMLKSYLSHYFVPASHIVTCPYPGSDMQSGVYDTYGNTQLVYTDDGSSLSVRLSGSDEECPVSSLYDYFPFVYSDGSFHFIDGILKLY